MDSPEVFAIKSGVNNEETQKLAGITLKELFEAICDVLDYYIDMKESTKKIIALWIIGTHVHKEFNTFPYLYLNAQKASGKTRTLRLCEFMTYHGKLINNISESALFRSAEKCTILIDEFEPTHKAMETLRLLLNSGYKKGAKVERVMKKKTPEGDKMDLETFNIYTPVGIANIEGLGAVLQDRCISEILEKSNNPEKTKLIENFSENEIIKLIKRTFDVIRCSLCSLVYMKNIQNKWNTYITTLTTHTTYTTLTTLTTLNTLADSDEKNKDSDTIFSPEDIYFFDLIKSTSLDGRHLELYFPLFVIAWLISDETLEEVIQIAAANVEEQRKDALNDDVDVSLIEFISTQPETLDYINISQLVKDFRDFYTQNEENPEWLNTRWIGKALRRLNLIRESRRVGRGVQVMLNVSHAYDKLKIHKDIRE